MGNLTRHIPLISLHLALILYACIEFQHTVATIGDPPRPVADIDLRGVKFGTLPQCFYEEFTVYDKVLLTQDLSIFLRKR